MELRNRIPRLPTSAEDWRLTASVTAETVSKPVYAFLTIAVSFVSLTAFVLPGNLSLVLNVVVFGEAPLTRRLSVLADLYPFFGGAEGPTAALIILVGLLIGVNFAVVLRGYRTSTVASAGGSTTGAVLGFLGAGCAACGSAVLAAVFSASAVAGAVAFLPLEGAEFTVLAVAVLLVSMFWSAESTREGCSI